MYNKQRGNAGVLFTVAIAVILLIVIVLGGWPVYRVWQQGLQGEAALARATQERQIRVEAAQAELDASVLLVQSIGNLGEAAKEYPEYRQQEFMAAFADALRDGNISQIIYVPTEANIPILEAGKR